ncbi:ADP-ribosylglycohydrolase family protein [Endozoicomonas arenosclerae]|uniref:ADP-ribosylglycohydrolase family protein n=1 Tax=Endozoicomonas arenosclerae TaxID=1633495 RepID=UPI0007844A62|nr:ADP-ribosylglycohydrolase family protein [Endozoicomonas arenosclerae]
MFQAARVKSLLIVLLALGLIACHAPSAKSPSDSGSTSMSSYKPVKHFPADISREKRVMGAIMGYLAGDAMGLGIHWYYNLDELHKDYGPWVDSYQNPTPDGSHSFAQISRFRHEQGVRAGDVSQTGQIFTLLLESVAAQGRYDENDFHRRLDEFFKTLNGESYSGRYTESIIKSLWASRQKGVAWNDPAMATASDTSDGAQLAIILALIYEDAETLAIEADRLMKPLFKNDFIRQNQVVYAMTLQALIKGIQLPEMRDHLIGLLQNPVIKPLIGGYDNTFTVSNGSIAWHPDKVRVEPPLYISHVYGTDCQLTHLLPAAYYLIHRFPNDFEMGMLSAANGGGNNMARAALTGALLGAMTGVSAIPPRFIKNLENSELYLRLGRQVASHPVPVR